MTEKTNTSLILQTGILALLILNVSISFTAFGFLQPLSYLVWGMCCVSFLGLGIYFVKKPVITYLDMCILAYITVLVISTLLNGTDIKTAIYRSIEVIVLMLVYNHWERPDIVIKTFAAILSLCAYLNLLIMILFPDWMFVAKDVFDSHLLGGNYNQIGSRLIFALILTVPCMRFSKWWLVNFIFLSIVSIVILAMVGSMTSLSCIIVFLLFCMIPSIRLQKAGIVLFFIFYLLFQFGVCFNGEGLYNNKLAVFIIEDVLGKDITFTNRTQMWASAAEKFAESPIMGYGFVDREWYLTQMDSFAIGPHNFIYSVLLNGGLILITILIAAVVITLRRLIGHLDKTATLMLMGTCIFLFMSTMEVYPFFFFFGLLYALYYYPDLNPERNGNQLQ